MRYFSPLGLVMLISVCSVAQTPLRSSLTPAQWQADIKYFGRQLAKRHKNAFHHVSKEEFDRDIEQLYNDAPSLPDYQIIVRLQQITAKDGDGHTTVHIPPWFHRYPVNLHWFGDDLYVLSSTEKYKAALGTRLLKIGEFTLKEVYNKIKLVFSQDENKWYDMNVSPFYLTKPEVLVTLGIVPEYERASFTFIDSLNTEIKLELTPIPSNLNTSFLSAKQGSAVIPAKTK